MDEEQPEPQPPVVIETEIDGKPVVIESYKQPEEL